MGLTERHGNPTDRENRTLNSRVDCSVDLRKINLYFDCGWLTAALSYYNAPKIPPQN